MGWVRQFLMSDNKNILKNSGILYVRLLIITVVGLFSSRVVLRSLGASDFGLYNVVGGIVVMINLLNTAMVSTSFRYIAFEMGRGDTDGVNRVFNVSVIVHGCLAIAVVLLAETVGIFYIHHFLNVPSDRLGDAVFVFRLSVVATVFSILSVPYQGLVTAQEQFTYRSIVEVVSALLRLATAVALLYWGGDRLRLYAVLTALVIILAALMYLVYCRRNYASIVAWKFQRDAGKYKEMIGFAWWVMLGAAACIGKVQGAALIINVFFGTVLNAAFGIANQVNQLILTFTQNLGQAAIPQITKSYSSGNTDRSMQLVCYMTKYSFFLMLLPALPILLETRFLLHLWLGEVPEYTAVFCQLMICGALIDCLSAAIPAAIHATGNIKNFQIAQSAVSLVSLPIAWGAFMLGYPPYSILVVYLVTSTINAIVSLVLLRVSVHFDLGQFLEASYLKIAYVAACVSPLFVIRSMCHEGLLRFVVLSVAAVLWLAAIVFVMGIEKKERTLILSVLKDWQLVFSRNGARE